MDLERRPGESPAAYHKRLVYGKLIDKTLADYDYAELAIPLYGKEYSSDNTRRMMYGSCKTLQLFEDEQIGAVSNPELLSELEASRIELQKERMRFYDQRTAYNKILRCRARQEELNEIIVSAIERGDLVELPAPRVWSESGVCNIWANDVVASLTDIHFGACVNNHWNKYDPDICAEMLSNYAAEIINIGKVHSSHNCYIWANGDMISGNIHKSIAVTNKENVIQQIKGVAELISQFLVRLGEEFETVTFLSVAGNHSRIDDKDKAMKDERLDDLVSWWLEARLANYDYIKIDACEKIDTTMYAVNIRGKKYCGVHGDYDNSDTKIQTLNTMAGGDVYAVLTGHLHHNKIDTVSGIKVVMGGSFLGMDDLCIQRRIYGKQEQIVLICDEDGIRCVYDVPLHCDH